MRFNLNKYIKVSSLIIAIILIVIGSILQISDMLFIKKSLITEATISSIEVEKDINNETNYEVYVTYTINNKKYNERLRDYNFTMKKGQKVQIFYDPNNPSHIKNNSITSKYTGFIIMCVGIVFLLAYLKAKEILKEYK